MATATSAGVRLHYVEAGAGEPALVFVPGWCCDHRFFQPQLDHFQATHHVVGLDPRGFGESERPDSGYDIPAQADDVARVCRELGLTRPVIVGHSLGAMIGVELGARHPSIPGAIIAVDPGPLAMRPEARAAFESLVDALEGPDARAALRTYVGGMFLPTDDAERRAWIVDTMSSAPLDVAAAIIRGVIEWNGAGALQLCPAPLLVLKAGPGPGGSNEPGRLLAIRPNIKFGVTVGAGHFHQLEVPEQVNAMIERFLLTLD
jgi:pimeloyl-ACP methyl ester carboxylesterase